MKKVILSSLLVILFVKGLEALSCQKCSYTYLASNNKDIGDKDCKRQPKLSRMSSACSASGGPWKCGVAHVQATSGSFIYERACVTSSDCSNKKFTHTLDGKNVEDTWNCCDDKDNCNHGNSIHANLIVSMATLTVVLFLIRP